MTATAAKFRCSSCGVRIPRRQARPFICSYCAGDPRFGTDGYFRAMIDDEIAFIERGIGEKLSPMNRLAWERDLRQRSAWDLKAFNLRRKAWAPK